MRERVQQGRREGEETEECRSRGAASVLGSAGLCFRGIPVTHHTFQLPSLKMTDSFGVIYKVKLPGICACLCIWVCVCVCAQTDLGPVSLKAFGRKRKRECGERENKD